jgi:hypothetical protein
MRGLISSVLRPGSAHEAYGVGQRLGGPQAGRNALRSRFYSGAALCTASMNGTRAG